MNSVSSCDRHKPPTTATPSGWRNSAPAPVPPGVPIETTMSVLGLTGLTAYFGLLEIGRPQPGETVVVSAAAGAVGFSPADLFASNQLKGLEITDAFVAARIEPAYNSRVRRTTALVRPCIQGDPSMLAM